MFIVALQETGFTEIVVLCATFTEGIEIPMRLNYDTSLDYSTV